MTYLNVTHHRKNKLIISYVQRLLPCLDLKLTSVSSLYGLLFITSAERSVMIMYIAFVSKCTLINSGF